MSHNSFLKLLVATAALALLAGGCGKGSDVAPLSAVPAASTTLGVPTAVATSCTVPTVQQNTCYSGMIPFMNTCVYPGQSLADRCLSIGGAIAANSAGVQLCQVQTPYWLSLSAQGSLLTQANPCGTSMANTIIPIKAGDLLSVDNLDGAWGTPNYKVSSAWIFSYWTTSSNSCEQVSLAGVNSDGSIMKNGTLAAGLVASDGAQVFEIGSGITDKLLVANGNLKIGFNLPTDSQYSACGGLDRARVKIKHCEDVNGTTYSCQ